MSKHFTVDLIERALKTFAQALLAALTVSGATVVNIDWLHALTLAGTAALVSVLTSVASYPATGSASLVTGKDTPGRHAAPEEDSSPTEDR